MRLLISVRTNQDQSLNKVKTKTKSKQNTHNKVSYLIDFRSLQEVQWFRLRHLYYIQREVNDRPQYIYVGATMPIIGLLESSI